MNSLPPLPLIDGALFIDNSGFVEGINTCTRYLQYKVLNNRISAGEKSSLNFGSATHIGGEFRYVRYQNKEVDDLYYQDFATLLSEFYAKHPVPSDDWRTMNWCMEVIKKYNTKYFVEEFSLLKYKEPQTCPVCNANPNGVLIEPATEENGKRETWRMCLFCRGTGKRDVMVELPFAIELYRHENIPVFYTGRIDLPVSIDNQIFVLDHKTTSMIGEQFWNEYRMSAQPRGYAWAFQELTGQKVAGYIINVIRTKEVPQYVLNGKTTSRAGKTYTAESWWNETFQRERFLIKHDQNELEEWKNNTIEQVEQFFWHYSRGYFPMKTKWCSSYGKCPYYDVCSLAQSDRGVMLASGMFQDNTWSPLNKNDILLNPTQPKQ